MIFMSLRDEIREALARSDMPQVKAFQHEAVIDKMITGGIGVVDMDVSVDDLKPVQDGINRQKVQNIKDAWDAGETMHPIIASRDGYIIDGHHRWIAAKEAGNDTIPCCIVKLQKDEALAAIQQYSEDPKVNENKAAIPMKLWVLFSPAKNSNSKPVVKGVATTKSLADRSGLLSHEITVMLPHIFN